MKKDAGTRKKDREQVEFVVIDELSGGAVQDEPDPASVRIALAAADSGRGESKHLLSLVSGIHAAGRNAMQRTGQSAMVM